MTKFTIHVIYHKPKFQDNWKLLNELSANGIKLPEFKVIETEIIEMKATCTVDPTSFAEKIKDAFLAQFNNIKEIIVSIN